MENDSLNPSTNQLLIQHFSEAAVFTDPGFAITACNPAASALFLYNQQAIQGHSISILIPASSTNSNQPSIIHTTFTGGIIEYIDGTGKIIQLHTTRHAIAPGLPNGVYLFIYKPLEADQMPTGFYAQDDGAGFDMQTLAIKKTLGLLGMKERTLMMGGRFEINSKPGEGTTIIVTTSLQADDITKLKTDQ